MLGAEYLTRLSPRLNNAVALPASPTAAAIASSEVIPLFTLRTKTHFVETQIMSDIPVHSGDAMVFRSSLE